MTPGRWIGSITGLAVLIAFLLMPPFASLTGVGMKTTGIFLSTIIWWATVGTDYPSIVCIVLLAITGVMTPSEAFSSSLGSWAPAFLIGCFGLSEGMRASGFSRRFAVWFITRPFTAGHPWLLAAMFLLACTLLASVMSSTASCIVFMTIAAPLLETLGYKKGDDFSAAFMMGIAWAATAALSNTPIAHASNVLVMEWIQRDFGYTVTFPQWMAFGIPMGLLIYLLIFFTLKYVVRPDISRSRDMTIEEIRHAAGEMGPMQLNEKFAVGIFLAVVVCWMLPGLAEGVLPGVAAFFQRIGYAVPPLAGAVLLCIVRVDGKQLLSFKQWMNDGVEWGSTMLCAAIMAIGVALSNPATGITELLTGIFQPMANTVPAWAFILISILWVILQTNLMPNLVSMTLVYSIMVPVAAAAGIGNPVALGAAITAASNCAFSLPSATTTTALVVGTGWVKVGFLGKNGAILLIPLVLAFTFICYTLCTIIFS